MPRSGNFYVERRPSDDPVIAVIEVVLAEEHRERVRADHRVGSNLPNELHELASKCQIVVDLAVEMPETANAGEPEHLGGLIDLYRALAPRASTVSLWTAGIRCPLVTLEVHVAR